MIDDVELLDNAKNAAAWYKKTRKWKIVSIEGEKN